MEGTALNNQIKEETDSECTNMYELNNPYGNAKPSEPSEDNGQTNKLGALMQEFCKHDNGTQNIYLQNYSLRPVGMVQPDGRLIQPNLKPELLLATPDIPKYAYHSDSNSQLLPAYQKETGDKNCAACEFRKNHKSFLTPNSPPVMMDKCSSCCFDNDSNDNDKKYPFILRDALDSTIFKDVAKKCVQRKKPATDGKWFTCETCFYETKYKYRLNQHTRLMHLDSSEVERVKCPICEFQTKFKESLKRHMLIHGDPSEIAMHKCSVCMFQTKLKVSLKRHMLIHSDPSELEMHKCTICVFQTKFKDSLKRHMNTHSQKPSKSNT